MPLTISVPLPSTRSPLLQLTLNFAEGISSSSADLMGTSLAGNYSHTFFPTVFPGFNSAAKFTEHCKEMLTVFGRIDVADIKELVEPPEHDSIIMHFHYEGTTTFRLPYANDNVFIFHSAVQSDGATKIISGKEWINAKFAAEVGQKVMESREKQKAGSA